MAVGRQGRRMVVKVAGPRVTAGQAGGRGRSDLVR